MKRLAFVLLWFCGSACCAQSRTAPDTIAARAQACSTCHGINGEGTADVSFPRIAGKPAGYLFNQLQNFRDGQRSYPPMNYLLAYMDDDFLAELAAFFAAQPPPNIAVAESAASADDTGRRLVTRGAVTSGIPACVQCHGAQLGGIQPGIPGLNGLNERYIAAQLVSWRVGTRHAKAPDCMREIATRLTDLQVREVATWLATRSGEDASLPAPAGAWTTPLPCGSQP